jgi:hypothetical protein
MVGVNEKPKRRGAIGWWSNVMPMFLPTDCTLTLKAPTGALRTAPHAQIEVCAK